MMIKRITMAALGAGLLMMTGAGFASAAEPTGARDAAAQAVDSGQLAGFFARAEQHSGARGVTANSKHPSLTGEVLTINTLNPEFVKGAKGAAPSTVSRHAVKAESGTGQQASVWLAEQNGAWKVQNLSTDAQDVTFTAQGGNVFTEPQINAWYRVTGDTITPLNDSAREAVGTQISVAKYQDRVQGLYADKLPGSDYANKKLLAGYPMPGTAGQHEEDGFGYGVPAVALGLLLAGGGAAYVVRRRVA
ncbi:hypothetical protein D5S17_13500 [Pseudonocardiaceae bacterium YIM PH 21723]|nr:hypothetical protein D5S17_13500 [Pseudonocardiaceae bacterium YIM PH 21723]